MVGVRQSRERGSPEESGMKRIFDLIGMSVGGWLGWAVGAWISVFTAFVAGMIGTGVGLYLTRRITKSLLP